jgi:hypothetical protein
MVGLGQRNREYFVQPATNAAKFLMKFVARLFLVGCK